MYEICYTVAWWYCECELICDDFCFWKFGRQFWKTSESFCSDNESKIIIVMNEQNYDPYLTCDDKTNNWRKKTKLKIWRVGFNGLNQSINDANLQTRL